MSPLEIALGVGKGVAELVQMGILSAANAKQAEDVLVKNMKPTPSSAEVDEFRSAKNRLGIADEDTDPPEAA